MGIKQGFSAEKTTPYSTNQNIQLLDTLAVFMTLSTNQVCKMFLRIPNA